VTDTSSIRARALDNVSAFVAAAGLEVTQLGADRVEGFIELGPGHHQPWGIVHGGVYATAIETAASLGAAVAASEHGLVPVGVNNNTNFVRAMKAGRVKVVATPVQQGRTQQLWEVRVSDEDNRLVAIGQVRLQNTVPRP
jgi:1,4-dihydroxy-2-naphthoyl-CoA hydrolase